MDAEVCLQLFGGFVIAEAKEPCNIVDDITGFVTCEAVVSLIHLHAGVMVIMKKTECHPVWGDTLSIKFGSLPGGDGCFDGLKNAYRRSPFCSLHLIFHSSDTLYGENRLHSSKLTVLHL